MLADFEDLADEGVIEGGGGNRFAREALAGVGVGGQVRREHLDRDFAAKPQIAGPVDLPHAAAAQRGVNLIRTKPGPGTEHSVPVGVSACMFTGKS